MVWHRHSSSASFSNFAYTTDTINMFLLFYIKSVKGQLISKANCHAMNSSKKRSNEFVFTTMRRVFVRFWKELKTPKKHFEII